MATQDRHKGTPLRMWLPPDLHAWLAEEAEARDVSVAHLVTKAVRHLPAHLHGGPVMPPPGAAA